MLELESKLEIGQLGKQGNSRSKYSLQRELVFSVSKAINALASSELPDKSNSTILNTALTGFGSLIT